MTKLFCVVQGSTRLSYSTDLCFPFAFLQKFSFARLVLTENANVLYYFLTEPPYMRSYFKQGVSRRKRDAAHIDVTCTQSKCLENGIKLFLRVPSEI